jgi:hypothetical protein
MTKAIRLCNRLATLTHKSRKGAKMKPLTSQIESHTQIRHSFCSRMLMTTTFALVFVMIGLPQALAQVRVRDVENPARNPFVVEGTVNFGAGELLTELGEVPAGKRAVIEVISMICQTEPPDTIVFVDFAFARLNGFPHYFLPISKQGDPGESIFQSWATAQLVRIYADEGKIFITVGRSNPNTTQRGGCRVNISGHTIDVQVN